MTYAFKDDKSKDPVYSAIQVDEMMEGVGARELLWSGSGQTSGTLQLSKSLTDFDMMQVVYKRDYYVEESLNTGTDEDVAFFGTTGGTITSPHMSPLDGYSDIAGISVAKLSVAAGIRPNPDDPDNAIGDQIQLSDNQYLEYWYATNTSSFSARSASNLIKVTAIYGIKFKTSSN